MGDISTLVSLSAVAEHKDTHPLHKGIQGILSRAGTQIGRSLNCETLHFYENCSTTINLSIIDSRREQMGSIPRHLQCYSNKVAWQLHNKSMRLSLKTHLQFELLNHPGEKNKIKENKKGRQREKLKSHIREEARN